LADALAGCDFAPWLCEVDIDRGENFVAKINEGLAQSDLALLVWSPDAAKSSWTEQEWTSLLAQQVEEHKVRLGIILLRDHPLPPLLRTSNRIEARCDHASAIRETLDWLKGRQRVQRLSGLKAPVYLPDYRPKDFVGREIHLNALLREQVWASWSAEELDKVQQAHAAALEALFASWETHWSDCRQCLQEIIPAGKFLWDRKVSGPMHSLTDNGIALALGTGGLEEGFRILLHVESLYAGRTDRDAIDVLQRGYGNQAVALHDWGAGAANYSGQCYISGLVEQSPPSGFARITASSFKQNDLFPTMEDCGTAEII